MHFINKSINIINSINSTVKSVGGPLPLHGLPSAYFIHGYIVHNAEPEYITHSIIRNYIYLYYNVDEWHFNLHRQHTVLLFQN